MIVGLTGIGMFNNVLDKDPFRSFDRIKVFCAQLV